MKKIKKISVSLLAMATLLIAFGLVANAAVSNLAVSISNPANNSSVSVNQPVTFSATASGGVAPYTYLWVFGDGSVGAGPSFVKTFGAVGNQSVTVRVTDSTTNQATSIVNLSVTSGASQKPVITNIAVSNVTQTGATITWTTDIPSSSRVIYDTVSHPDISGATAPNFSYGFSTEETDVTTKVTSHSVTVSGLSPATKYYFRVLSQG